MSDRPSNNFMSILDTKQKSLFHLFLTLRSFHLFHLFPTLHLFHSLTPINAWMWTFLDAQMFIVCFVFTVELQMHR